MRKFLLWDQDGVLVDTERWFFVTTQECLRELGLLRFWAGERTYPSHTWGACPGHAVLLDA